MATTAQRFRLGVHVAVDRFGEYQRRFAWMLLVGAPFLVVVITNGQANGSIRTQLFVAWGASIAISLVACLRLVAADRRTVSAAHPSLINAELQWRATHDLLMGVPNRELLQAELQRAVEAASSGETRVGLLFLDLDRFKHVNDTLGHSAGDALLVAVGQRIEAAVADEDAMVARVGGDELVVLLRDITTDDHLGRVADKLLDRFRDPFSIDGVQLAVGTSIGMAESAPGESADDLYRHADVALYEAKKQGRRRAVFADANLKTRRRARVETERDLRKALHERDIASLYQPEIDLVTGIVRAAEAIPHWAVNDDLIMTGALGTTQESPELRRELMLRIADHIWAWRQRVDHPLPIGIKVAISDLAELLAKHHADPLRRPLMGMQLLIAESDLPDDLSQSVALLTQARVAGAQVFLDGFGGASQSLRMLSDLPIDGFKIDRSFVDRVGTDIRVRRLLVSLVDFARSSGLIVVAGSIETGRQAAFMTELGVDVAQGPLFGPPVSAAELEGLMSSGWDDTELAGGF